MSEEQKDNSDFIGPSVHGGAINKGSWSSKYIADL